MSADDAERKIRIQSMQQKKKKKKKQRTWNNDIERE